MSIYYWLLDLYLVHVLRRELHGEAYRKFTYMCVVVSLSEHIFVRGLLKRRIYSLIGGERTLFEYIYNTMQSHGYTVWERQLGYFNCSNTQRHLMHIVFWELAIKHLSERKQGPVKFNPQDLGIYKTRPVIGEQHA